LLTKTPNNIIMKKIIYAFITLSLIYSSAYTKNFNFEVVDGDGRAVEGAEVLMSFSVARDTSIKKTAITDDQGHATVKALVIMLPHMTIEKEGYYTVKALNVRPLEDEAEKIPFIMRKVKNPIPLLKEVFYDNENRSAADLSVNDGWVGYDLMENDWVQKGCRGQVVDFFIRINKEYGPTEEGKEKVQKATMELKFPQQHDGICFLNEKEFVTYSKLKFPHLAPENGYKNSLTRERLRDRGYDIFQFVLGNVYFRTRTLADSKGNLIRGIHTKVENFAFYFRSPVTFTGTYHLNPRNLDRNLEFDLKNNIKPKKGL